MGEPQNAYLTVAMFASVRHSECFRPAENRADG